MQLNVQFILLKSDIPVSLSQSLTLIPVLNDHFTMNWQLFPYLPGIASVLTLFGKHYERGFICTYFSDIFYNIIVLMKSL